MAGGGGDAPLQICSLASRNASWGIVNQESSLAPECGASVPPRHFYTEFSPAPFPPPSSAHHKSPLPSASYRSAHRSDCPPFKSEAPLLARDSQAPGDGEGLDWETRNPIHQAEITGQLKQPARGNLELGCQLPPRAFGEAGIFIYFYFTVLGIHLRVS